MRVKGQKCKEVTWWNLEHWQAVETLTVLIRNWVWLLSGLLGIQQRTQTPFLLGPCPLAFQNTVCSGSFAVLPRWGLQEPVGTLPSLALGCAVGLAWSVLLSSLNKGCSARTARERSLLSFSLWKICSKTGIIWSKRVLQLFEKLLSVKQPCSTSTSLAGLSDSCFGLLLSTKGLPPLEKTCDFLVFAVARLKVTDPVPRGKPLWPRTDLELGLCSSNPMLLPQCHADSLFIRSSPSAEILRRSLNLFLAT